MMASRISGRWLKTRILSAGAVLAVVWELIRPSSGDAAGRSRLYRSRMTLVPGRTCDGPDHRPHAAGTPATGNNAIRDNGSAHHRPADSHAEPSQHGQRRDDHLAVQRTHVL